MAKASSRTHVSTPDDEDDEPDPERVLQSIQRRAGDIERQELEYALSRLEARGGVADRRERVLSELADAIVAEILAGPESILADADEVDTTTLRAAMDLFAAESTSDRSCG